MNDQQSSTSSPTKIAVLGAGSWGTTFAKVLADANADASEVEVRLWARRESIAEEINTTHTNSTYLKEVRLPENLQATSDFSLAISDAAVVVLAVPSQHVRTYLTQMRDSLRKDAVVVSLIKGLERGTDKRISQVIADETGLPAEQIAIVSGPNLAMEIAHEEPTASVVASQSMSTARFVADLCNPAYFRPYTNTDVVGVEIAGVVKNVIALAVGICDGQNLGDNSKASVITRGLAEATRLASAVGGRLETFAGLAGLGDVVATCGSPLSRNRTAGRLLGLGMTAEEVVAELTQTAEGMRSATSVLELAAKYEVDMPICQSVVAVLDGKLPVENIAGLLLARDLKSEET